MATQLELMGLVLPRLPRGGVCLFPWSRMAFETGDVDDREGLQLWLEDCLLRGAGRNDAINACAHASRPARNCR